MTENKKKSISLGNWILIAMILGFIVGMLINLFVSDPFIKDTILIDNLFYFFGTGFIDLMKMLVVPLVFCSIVVGVASISNNKKFGNLSIKIIILFLATTLLAVCIAMLIAGVFRPGDGFNIASSVYTTNLTTNTTAVDTLLNMIPSNPFESLANGAIIPTIIFAALVGVVLSRLKEETQLVKDFFTQANKVMIDMTFLVLKIAPIGVFCLMAETFAKLGIAGLIPLIKFIVCVIIVFAVQAFIVYPILLYIFTRLSPITFYKKYVPVMLFAFSSTSSNATIPLHLEKMTELGVPSEISSFTIPLGATINMDGNAIMQGVGIMFATQAYGIDLGTSALITVIFTAVIASISAAGVPSAAIVSLNMSFMSIGLPLDVVTILLGIDHFVDMFRTTVNVTGDAICTLIVSARDKSFNRNAFNSKNTSK